MDLSYAGKGTCCVPAQGTFGPSISAISITPNFKPTVSNRPPSNKGKTGLVLAIVLLLGASVSVSSSWLLVISSKREGCKQHKMRDSCPLIKNILLLDSEGKRIAVKYYSDDWPTQSAKLAYEKSVFVKTQRTNARNEAEIIMLDNNIVVYKFVQDLHFFVTGGDDENEPILDAVLNGFVDSVTLILRNNTDKNEALENLDLILLCLDEIVDGGMILETDANTIAGKVATSSIDPAAPLADQTISQALAMAREHLTRSLLS